MAERYTPQVGDHLVPDGWGFGENLEADDGYSDGSFPGCEFRLPAGLDRVYRLAVNVKVTGGDHIVNFGRYRSRCRIEFVGDGEPSTFTGGWIYHS